MKIRSKIATTLGVAGAIIALTAGPASAAPADYWASGRCYVQFTREIGTNSKIVTVVNTTGGLAQMSVQASTPYQPANWYSASRNGFVERGFSWGLDLRVHTFCEVNGNFKIGPVLNY